MAPPIVGSGASEGRRRGAWSKEEDSLLKICIGKYGVGNWHLVSERAGLKRCRKSCRLRWFNYLSPNIKRGTFSIDEDDLIIRMQRLLGNRWSLIAGRIAGRTANDVKNHWNSYLAKKGSARSPATTTLPAAPPAQTVVYKPQARRVSMRMRALLREMFSPKDQRSLNPPRSCQPLDAAKMADGQLLIAPEPSTSSLPWLPVEDDFALGGGGADWFHDDQRSFNPPSSFQLLDGAKMADGQLLTAPEPSTSNLPWLPVEDEFALGGGGGGGGDWFHDDQRSLNPHSSCQTLDGAKMADGQLLTAPEPSTSSLPWLPVEDEFALGEGGGGGGGGDWFHDAQLDDLLCNSFLWDWTKDYNGSSPLH